MKQCNQCGKCCIKYSNGGLSASAEEIQYWDQYRPHIYEYVSDGKIWSDPNNGQPLTQCPWLRKQENNMFTCDIYFDRPDDCKYYPTSVLEMINDKCEMLETSDLKDTKRAQQQLNIIMADSRK